MLNLLDDVAVHQPSVRRRRISRPSSRTTRTAPTNTAPKPGRQPNDRPFAEIEAVGPVSLPWADERDRPDRSGLDRRCVASPRPAWGQRTSQKAGAMVWPASVVVTMPSPMSQTTAVPTSATGAGSVRTYGVGPDRLPRARNNSTQNAAATLSTSRGSCVFTGEFVGGRTAQRGGRAGKIEGGAHGTSVPICAPGSLSNGMLDRRGRPHANEPPRTG